MVESIIIVWAGKLSPSRPANAGKTKHEQIHIEQFTAQLESGRLDEKQTVATRASLANARLRWDFLEMQAAADKETLKNYHSVCWPEA